MIGWHNKPIGEIGAIHSGSTPSTTIRRYWNGNIPFVTPEDLSGIHMPHLYATKRMITQDGLNSCSATLLQPGSVVISSRAPIGYVAIPQVSFSTNQGCKTIVPKSEYNSLFVYYSIKFNVERLRRVGEGTTFAEISKEALSHIDMLFPDDVREQAKIASVLSAIDDAIQQTEAVIEKQKRIKTGLMQDLLTKGIDEHGRIRSEETHEFKDSPLGRIPVEWDVKPAHELCMNVIDCKNRTPPAAPEGYPVIRTPNVRDGCFVCEDLLFTDEVSYIVWTMRGKPKPGDIVMTREAPFGEVCMIPHEIASPCLGQRIMLFRSDPTRLHNEFFVHVAQSNAVQRHLLALAGGSTVGHIRVGDMRSLAIPHPKSVEEQINISNALMSITQELDNTMKSAGKLVRLKAGLMQDLLTATVSVAPLLSDSVSESTGAFDGVH